MSRRGAVHRRLSVNNSKAARAVHPMIDAKFLSFVAQRRWDIYGPIHKGLRLAHAQLIVRLGAADPIADQKVLLEDLLAHLDSASGHLDHEDSFIHPALEGATPGATRNLAEHHRSHRDVLVGLRTLIDGVQTAPRETRPAAWRELYLAFCAFVAADLEHMHHEETVIWPLLCARFSDEELADLEMRIVGSLSPGETVAAMRIMLPAMAPEERIGLLSGMKASAPPEAYRAVIAQAAKPTLANADFAELERLGLAA